ncbi:Origin recognition complex, subunit 1, partial [Ceratobasidium sp. 394]
MRAGLPGAVRYAWPDKPLARRVLDYSRHRDGSLLQKLVYHTGFERIFTTSKKPRQSLEGVQLDNYAIGDTVLVATKSGEPYIAVIVAMWYIQPAPNGVAECDNSDDDDDDFLDEARMHILVHKFLRPALDLPKIRLERPYRKKEIYYAVNRENASVKLRVPPSSILRRCNISSDPTRFSSTSLTETQWAAKTPATEPAQPQTLPPETPSKRGRPSRNAAQQTDSTFDFLCLSAHDAQRGLYYDFSWELFRKDALKLSVPSRKYDDFDGNGWNLPVDGTIPMRKTKPAAATPKPKPTKQTPKAAKPRSTKPKSSAPTTPTKSTSRPPSSVPVYKDDPDSDSDTSSSAGGSDIYEPVGDGPEDFDELANDDVPDDLGEDEDPVTDEEAEGEVEDAPQTPRKARPGATSPSKRGRPRKQDDGLKTPSKPRAKRIAAPTPHSKAALKKRRSVIDLSRLRGALAIGEDPSLGVAASTLPDSVGSDPHVRAMYALHVGARPGALPCRDNELLRVLGDVADLVTSGVGGCVYISGLPGTGKTATVHAVVRELKGMAMRNEISPFSYVEINGLRIPEPSAAYALLWEAISGHDATQHGHLSISPKEALRRLTRHFNSGSSAGSHACVVLMDELDQMVTAKQDVVYNFFNWPNLPQSNLVMIAVANTHDLPERTMSAKVRSRLGMERINFEAYTVQQLVEIVNARLEVAKSGQANQAQVMKPDAINFAARKVASIFGDARRVLDVCRRAVEV